MECEQSLRGLQERIEAEEREAGRNAKVRESRPTAQDVTLPGKLLQSLPRATRTRPVLARDAPDHGSTTWSTTSGPLRPPWRSSRARNPWETNFAAEPSAVSDDDAREWGSIRQRNSPCCASPTQHRPTARTKSPRPASIAMQRPFEHALVFW